jgi:hypothetical protein
MGPINSYIDQKIKYNKMNGFKWSTPKQAIEEEIEEEKEIIKKTYFYLGMIFAYGLIGLLYLLDFLYSLLK